MAKSKAPTGNVIASDLTPLVRGLVDIQGEVQAAATLGISRTTLARCVGGLPIRRGTAVQLRAVLAEPASTVMPDAAALVPILKAYVRLHGPVRAAASLGIDRTTLRRCVGGRPIHRGTAVQVSLALAALHPRAVDAVESRRTNAGT
jgi:transcriptional regulator of acetoin/glycerol metabolism